MSWGALADAVTAAAAHPVTAAPVAADLATEPTAPVSRLTQLLTASQLTRVSRRLALSIPAFRTGHTKITKQPGSWPLRAWRGDYLSPNQPAWLTNPDPRITYLELLSSTLDDGVFADRAYWLVTARGADGFPLRFRKLPLEDVIDDASGIRLVKGADTDYPGPVVYADGRILESIIPFRWSGMGGISGAGAVTVDLAVSLLAAATGYAKSPLPQTTLTAEGSIVLDDSEIDALLDSWDAKRAARATAYLQGVKLDTVGWSAKELQLVEAREHSALEIARALSLPASAVDSSNGASLEYSTTVENRRDLVEALRLWVAPIEQALTLHAAPRGTDLRHDVTSFLRDDPATRMSVWASGIASGVLTVAEARAQEPLATGSGT
jgi:Phage portal protein